MSRSRQLVYAAKVNYVFCVEGGGTKSRGALFAAGQPKALGQAVSGPCNPSSNLRAATAAVADMWQQIAESDSARTLARAAVRLCIGGAGMESIAVRRNFRSKFSAFADVLTISDGYAALVGAAGGEPCGMVVAGTGCAAHRLYPDGRSILRDGWGWLGGDRGSGAWLGLRALRHALAVQDCVAQGGLLAARMKRELPAERNQMAEWLVLADPRIVAGLAELVFDCADSGDQYACALLDRAADHLRSLARSLDCSETEALFLAGSIAKALLSRIAQGLQPAPQLLSEPVALEGCRLVSEGKVALEWAEQQGSASSHKA